MTETELKENEWYFFENRHPPVERNIIIMRQERRKFTIAQLTWSVNTEEQEGEWSWLTPQGYAYTVYPQDQWLMFQRLWIGGFYI